MATGLKVRAVSPTFEHDASLELRTSAYVYGDTAAARRALPAFTAPETQTCISDGLIAELRQHHYVTGAPQVGPATPISVGDQAQATQIRIPASYLGRKLTFHVGTSIVLSGRVIGLLTTVVGGSTPTQAGYEQTVARLLATRVAERETGQ